MLGLFVGFVVGVAAAVAAVVVVVVVVVAAVRLYDTKSAGSTGMHDDNGQPELGQRQRPDPA